MCCYESAEYSLEKPIGWVVDVRTIIFTPNPKPVSHQTLLREGQQPITRQLSLGLTREPGVTEAHSAASEGKWWYRETHIL